MAGNKKKDEVLGFFIILAIVLCLGAVLLGYWLSTTSGLYYNLEKSNRVEVRSGEELTSMGEESYNNEIVLMNDIHITDNSFSLGTEERPFRGVFNGNGRNVYCDFTSVEEGASLFRCIDREGIIKNVNFIFNAITVNGDSYGAIAGMNYGTIQNCTVSINDYRITREDGFYSAAVAINKGTISNVIVDSTFTLINNTEDEKFLIVGAVCAYNLGIVKNTISVPEFNGFNSTDEFKILTGEVVNLGIGAICAFTLTQGETDNCAMLIKNGVYTSDKTARYIVAYNKSEIFNSQTIFDVLDFDNRIWQFDAADNALRLVIAG